MSASLRRLRALSGALDQVFSSIGNGVIIFAVAVVSPPPQFGHIAILMTMVVAVMGCLRGALGTPLLLKADQSSDRIMREGSHALALSLAVGPLLAVAIIAVGSDLGSSAPIFLGIASPFVLGQDVLRYVAIADGRPHVAALWDGIWCAGSIALLVLTWLGDEFVTDSVLLGGWGALAVVAFLGLLANLRVRPRLRGWLGWLRAGLMHRVRYGIDAGLEQVTVFLVLTLVAVLASTTVTAALRGATALLAPIGLFGNAIQLIVIPESTRRASPPTDVWRVMLRIAVASAFVIAVFGGLVLYMLPARFGFFLLGDSWELSHRILPVTVVEYVATCFAVALAIFLRTFNRSADALALRIAMTVAAVTGATVTAVVFHNAIGVAIGLMTAAVLVAGVAFAWFVPWRSRERAASVDIAAGMDTPISTTTPAIPPVLVEEIDRGAAPGTTRARARWPVVLASLTAAMVAVSLYNAAQPREYTATAVIAVDGSGAEIFESEDMARRVIDWLGASEDPEQLADKVEASSGDDVMRVTVTVGHSAQHAANIVNAYGVVAGDDVAGVGANRKSGLPHPVFVKAASAQDATEREPDFWSLTAGGVLIGLAVGFALTWFIERLDAKRHRTDRRNPMPVD